MLSYFTGLTGCIQLKYLDQGNVANAYVSGMREDLHMYGNQYTYAVRLLLPLLILYHQKLTRLQGTAYTCAYAAMQIPSTLIIQKIQPSYWLACMEIGWGIFTFAQSGMQNVTQLYVFRFLVGFFESSFFPCILFVLGSW
jgi:ACS family pantothenate transporter-like MFS transporter